MDDPPDPIVRPVAGFGRFVPVKIREFGFIPANNKYP